MSHTRRDLIKLASAAMAVAQTAPVRAFADQKPSGEVSTWTTAGAQRFAPGAAVTWRPERESSADAVVLDPARKFQEILGFGAALTDSSCYVLNRMPAAARQELMEELLAPGKTALNVFRICIGSSDYATKPYSFDEGAPDPEMARFSIDHDREYILPVLKQARAINPDLFLLASPWSPPGWMKQSGTMLGGCMRKESFAPYAKYFVKFLQAYAEAGVPVQAVTVQNEVDTEQGGRMPACQWGQEYETEFVARHLGPQFAANRIATHIWIIDHNYNLWGRAIGELDLPEVKRYVDGVAWHGYLGEPTAMSRVHDAHPDKHAYWTEGGPDVRQPDYATNWSYWGKTFAGVLENWARCIIGWNIALDENGKPNIGPFECGGTVTVNSKTNEVTRSGQYWALTHYSHAFRRGARRIESSSVLPGVSHVAAVHPDGSYSAVLTNSGAERTVALRLAGMEAEVRLVADSVTTLSWRS
jgi:glucosylceramidase